MFAYPFTLYKSTHEAWTHMLRECELAEKTIFIEQYIFQDDEIGKQFINIFKEKVSKGIKVRILADMVGSYNFYNSELPFELHKLGIEVRFFNVISPWRIHNFTSWFFRNHKKTLIIDNKVAFTGGTGVGFHMGLWRDTTARLEGNVAVEIGESFEEMWWQVEDKRLVTRIRKLQKNKQKRDFITNSPFVSKRFLYYVFMESLRNAKKSIYLTTPYFIPDRRLRRILRLAAHRGVDVKIIVPKIIDVPVVESASHSLYDDLLKSGVRIFKYHPAILHAKTAIIDNEWATFGSFNLDSLSFLYNYEANVVTLDTKFIVEINKQFVDDLKWSDEVLYEKWKKRGFHQKFLELLTSTIRRFL